MKAVFPAILHLILATSRFMNNVIAQKPPQLLPNLWDKQKIVKPDTTVTLPCPVHGDKSSMIFDWYKDKELVVALGGYRHRVTGNGALRIKEVTAEDIGVYTCRAVNGFGSVEYNITLIVLDDNEEYDDVSEVETKVPEDISSKSNEDLSTPKMSSASMPYLLYVTEWNKTQHHILPGSSATFHCVATGYPKPRVTWLRNNGRELPPTAKRGRWSLRLYNLRERDSGNYTCIANNIMGDTSHSFIVDVSILSESSRAKPVLTGDYPSNATVEEGQMAMFQCMMRSVLPPHIQWLKRVEEHEMNGDDFRDVIKMENENFRVIKSSDAMGKSDGSFFNKLVIQTTRVSDSGKYICFGANTNGYSYRSAYLHVLPKTPMIDGSDIFPFPIVVTVIVLSLATIASIIAVLIYCRNRKRSRNRSYDNSTEMPMVTNEVFMLLQQQRYPPGVRTCNVPYEPTSRNPTHQVYVPNGTKNGTLHHSQTSFPK